MRYNARSSDGAVVDEAATVFLLGGMKGMVLYIRIVFLRKNWWVDAVYIKEQASVLYIVYVYISVYLVLICMSACLHIHSFTFFLFTVARSRCVYRMLGSEAKQKQSKSQSYNRGRREMECRQIVE